MRKCWAKNHDLREKSGIFLRFRTDTAFLSYDLKLEAYNYPLHLTLGKCHFLPGGGSRKLGDQILFLRSKGGSKDF